jgi:hypothetical protein
MTSSHKKKRVSLPTLYLFSILMKILGHKEMKYNEKKNVKFNRLSFSKNIALLLGGFVFQEKF